jgi:hypothetical protein
MAPSRKKLSKRHQASTKSHHAAHAVLNTNELLCNIVVCLPFEDVVNAANVCQTWRRALMDNVAIRQAMFLSPVDISDILSEVDCLFMNVKDIARDKYTVVGDAHSHVPTGWTPKTIFDAPEYGPMSKRPFGVWAEMFVTQSPSRTFSITLCLENHDPKQPYLQTLKLDFTCETGVKMGELHNFCRSSYESHDGVHVVDTEVAPESFTQEKYAKDRIGGRWEVRDGKVCRQTQPRLAELPDQEASSDEEDWDEELAFYRERDREHEEEMKAIRFQDVMW